MRECNVCDALDIVLYVGIIAIIFCFKCFSFLFMSLDSIPNWIMAASGVFGAYVTWLSYSIKHRPSPPKPDPIPVKSYIPEVEPESKSEQSQQGMNDGAVSQKEVQKREDLSYVDKIILGAILGAIWGAISGAWGGIEAAIVLAIVFAIAFAIFGTIWRVLDICNENSKTK